MFDAPRVVGLTASPASFASSVIKTQNKLEELRLKFGSNSGICTPDSDMSKIRNNDIKLERVLVSRSYLQKIFCFWFIHVMEPHRELLERCYVFQRFHCRSLTRLSNSQVIFVGNNRKFPYV